MNTTELPLPEKIFPVEYAGFFDFNEEGIYNTSVINRDDYPNADLIANEISKRYNNFDKMKEALEDIYDTLSSDDKVITQYLPEGEASYRPNNWINKAKQLLESLK